MDPAGEEVSVNGEWDDEEVTRRYVPRQQRSRDPRRAADLDSVLVLEQRVALLERSSLRLLSYLRRALSDRNRA